MFLQGGKIMPGMEKTQEECFYRHKNVPSFWVLFHAGHIFYSLQDIHFPICTQLYLSDIIPNLHINPA